MKQALAKLYHLEHEPIFRLLIWPKSIYSLFCQTPLQLANPTQLQLVWVGVDFVFPRKKNKKNKKKEEQEEEQPTPSFYQKEWPYMS